MVLDPHIMEPTVGSTMRHGFGPWFLTRTKLRQGLPVPGVWNPLPRPHLARRRGRHPGPFGNGAKTHGAKAREDVLQKP